MKFQAAILNELKKPLIVDQIELKQKLKTGQVLVKLSYSGICGSQIGEINGIKGKDKYLPHLLGHEGVGIVVDFGSKVTKIKIGDKVALHWKPSLGINSETPQYIWNKKKLNAGWITTFNEYAVISENRLTKIAKNSDNLESVLFGCAILTGFGVIKNDIKLKKGDNVIIFGAGGVGLNMIQASKFTGANKIIAVDIYDNRLNLAKKVGATKIINSKRKNFKEKLKQFIGNDKVDVFIDNTGNVNVIEMGYKLLKIDGTLALVGVTPHNSYFKIQSMPLHFGRKILGSHGGMAKPHVEIPKYRKIIKKNSLLTKELISDIYSLDNINEAIQSIKNGKSFGRVVLSFSEDNI